MKKTILGAALFILIVAFAFAQQAATGASADISQPSAGQIGQDTAEMRLKEVSVDKFEAAGFWTSSISTDDGISVTRQFEGAPVGKEQIADEKKIGIDPTVSDKYVIGTRTEFYKRGYTSIYIEPNRAIPIEGISKTVSVWVVGRNYNHVLKLMIEDAFGTRFELTMGKLNFQGWKKMTVAIPPQNVDGKNGIIQRNFHFLDKSGIKILGFKVETDPMESYGSYYIYFDDLRAETDLFAESNRDTDDMNDGW